MVDKVEIAYPEEPAREPELRRQIDNLGKQIEMLQGAAGALSARLGPVLVPDSPQETVEPDLSEVIQTEYASQINNYATAVQQVMRRLDSMLHRLEV